MANTDAYEHYAHTSAATCDVTVVEGADDLFDSRAARELFRSFGASEAPDVSADTRPPVSDPTRGTRYDSIRGIAPARFRGHGYSRFGTVSRRFAARELYKELRLLASGATVT